MLRRSSNRSKIDDGWNEMTTFAQKWWFRSRHPQKKLTFEGLGAPRSRLRAPRSLPEPSWRRLGEQSREKIAVILKVRRIWPPKTEPKTIKNRPQNPSNFRYLWKSIFSWIWLPKWRLRDPRRGSFFEASSFLHFWGMSLVKHQLLSFGGTPKWRRKAIKKHWN